VTSLTVAYTYNGKLWKNVDKGMLYQANRDRRSKVVIPFDEVVYARALKIYPQTWHKAMTMRVDAIYVDLE
jgi:hypothetical protein